MYLLIKERVAERSGWGFSAGTTARAEDLFVSYRALRFLPGSKAHPWGLPAGSGAVSPSRHRRPIIAAQKPSEDLAGTPARKAREKLSAVRTRPQYGACLRLPAAGASVQAGARNRAWRTRGGVAEELFIQGAVNCLRLLPD